MPPEGTKKRSEDEVLHEFPAIGKYRIRVLRKGSGDRVTTSLDVREYVNSDKFEGFTRRGIRLSDPKDIKALCNVMFDALDWFK